MLEFLARKPGASPVKGTADNTVTANKKMRAEKSAAEYTCGDALDLAFVLLIASLPGCAFAWLGPVVEVVTEEADNVPLPSSLGTTRMASGARYWTPCRPRSIFTRRGCEYAKECMRACMRGEGGRLRLAQLRLCTEVRSGA